MNLPTPRDILSQLLPHLRTAAAYARHIQPNISARPSKDSDNPFVAALSDADLSIQTAVEVALLGSFPQLAFYGEEYEQSYNTHYLRALDFEPSIGYLITLDPIDGTRFYLDGHSNYQIIMGVLDREDFAAAIAISPGQGRYYYALRGEGAFTGYLQDDLDDCQPLHPSVDSNSVYLSGGMERLATSLGDRYQVIPIATAYSSDVQVPNLSGLFSNDLSGAVLRVGKFIDGAALTFIAQEAGYKVTGYDGLPLPPLHTCSNYQRPGAVIAVSEQMHNDLLQALQ